MSWDKDLTVVTMFAGNTCSREENNFTVGLEFLKVFDFEPHEGFFSLIR